MEEQTQTCQLTKLKCNPQCEQFRPKGIVYKCELKKMRSIALKYRDLAKVILWMGDNL